MHLFNKKPRETDSHTIDGSTAHNSIDNQHGEVIREDKFAGTVGTPGNYPVLTFRTFFMAMLVAMGGFIFGYDTGMHFYVDMQTIYSHESSCSCSNSIAKASSMSKQVLTVRQDKFLVSWKCAYSWKRLARSRPIWKHILQATTSVMSDLV